MVKVEGQGRCMLEAGGYIFNTEAHPIDPAALACCSGLSEDEVVLNDEGFTSHSSRLKSSLRVK